MAQKKNYKYSGRKRGRFKKAALGFFVLAGVVAVAGALGVAVSARGLPDPLTIGQRKIFESTKIYDRTGKVLLYEVHGEEKRTVVPFAQINQRVKDATIVAEDFDFYEHSGIDFKSILRAFFIDVSRWEMSQGGSTISQQLVKKVFLSPEKTPLRKERVRAYSCGVGNACRAAQSPELLFSLRPEQRRSAGAQRRRLGKNGCHRFCHAGGAQKRQGGALGVRTAARKHQGAPLRDVCEKLSGGKIRG